MSCKFCKHYKVDQAERQVNPTMVIEVAGVKLKCKICQAEYYADIDRHKLYTLNAHERTTAI